jgi:CubicO group peptidase (beta-lactamase class C family)
MSEPAGANSAAPAGSFGGQAPQERLIRIVHVVDTFGLAGMEKGISTLVCGTPEFEPGTRHAYSNTGYVVLGLMLEKVTGMSYAAALEERITSRVGLRDTYLAAGTIDAAAVAGVGGSCQGCHAAHREKGADGAYKIK